VSMVADIKQQHKKDLAKAAEIYARKLYALKKDVEKYKKEAETLRASAVGDGQRDCDNAGVNIKTGVAQNDKENISVKREMGESAHSSRITKHEGDAIQHKGEINPNSQMLTARSENTRKTNANEKAVTKMVRGSQNELNDLMDPYERLFLEDYRLEKDAEYEEALKKCAEHKAAKNEKIRIFCQELMVFMEDVRANILKES
jgi:hypothetical protein